MNTPSTWTFLVVVGLVVHAGAPVQAQTTAAVAVIGSDDKPWNRGVPVETRQAARDLFLEGNRLFRVPLFAQAAEKYSAALARWKHPAFYFNLALAQLNLGLEVEAHDNLGHAVEHGEASLGADEFREAQKQLHDVERQLGRIQISCQTPGAEVTLDGATLFTGPGRYEGWVKAKPHEITASKPDYLSETRRVTASPGQLPKVELKLVTLSEAADTGRRWSTWKPWAVVAGGAAVVIAAGAAHTLSGRNFSDYDQQFQQLPCAASRGCSESDIPPSLRSQLRRATSEQQIAIGGYIGGGAVIAAGLALVYLNRPRLPARETDSAVALIPAMSSDTFGILVSIRQ